MHIPIKYEECECLAIIESPSVADPSGQLIEMYHPEEATILVLHQRCPRHDPRLKNFYQ